MDYLLNVAVQHDAKVDMGSFKPYYKWITF